MGSFGKDPVADRIQMSNLFQLFETKSYWTKDGDTDQIEDIANRRLCFEDFLVGVSVCFVDHMISDGINIFFKGNAMNGSTLCKADVMSIHAGISDEEDMKEYKEAMSSFAKIMFHEEDEQLDLEAFRRRVINTAQQRTIQLYLQMTLKVMLGIELDAKDFIDEEKVGKLSLGVAMNDMFRQSSTSFIS